MQKSSKLFFFSFILLVFTFSFISAISEVFVQTQDNAIVIEYPKIFVMKQNEDFHLRFHAFNKTDGKLLTNESINCTLNIYDSSGEGLIRKENLEFNVSHTENDCQHCFGHHISGGNFSEVGSYSYLIRCSNVGIGGSASVGFEITSTGLDPKSILNNSTKIILLTLAIILLIVGGALSFSSIGFIGSILLILVGIYTMIYGLNDVVSLYTQAIALVEIGLGIIFMFISAYEWLPWGKE